MTNSNPFPWDDEDALPSPELIGSILFPSDDDGAELDDPENLPVGVASAGVDATIRIGDDRSTVRVAQVGSLVHLTVTNDQGMVTLSFGDHDGDLFKSVLGHAIEAAARERRKY